MQYYLVAPTIVVRNNESSFTYHSDTIVPVGAIVRISVGKREVNGVVVAIAQKPTFKTKPIQTILTTEPLPRQLIELAGWLSTYYSTHLALVLQSILPSGLDKQRRTDKKVTSRPIRQRTNIVLNAAQNRAIAALTKSATGTFLLHGVTGSGKTQVYIEAAKKAAVAGRSAIVLVPEISLTPQLLAEFAHHFDNLVVTHSGLTEAERHLAWLQVLQHQDKPTIIIGPRSALFMPLNNVGLIVVDECHEPSYKQEQSPKYSALRAASILANAHNANLVLGSASPSVTDYYLAKSQKSIICLNEPAHPMQSTEIKVVDLKNKLEFKRHRFLSLTLLHYIEDAILRGEQTLLFHNRRGTAPTTMCDHCGWTAHCVVCFLPLTLHADQHKMRCHVCASATSVPPSCPECGEPTITFKGIGTKLIEKEIAKLFPKARIARFDADNHKDDAIHNRYQELYDGTIDIMIGTQMLAKGLDLPRLSTVGVIQADSGLVIPDYQAEERTFQLLYQVIGRAGRTATHGKVVIQSYQPTHPAVQAAVHKDYGRFYKAEIVKRKNTDFPPFCYLLKLTCSYKTEEGAIHASRSLAQKLKKAYPSLTFLGPAPAFYERLGGAYRWQIIVKSHKRAHLQALARDVPQAWQIDLDPISLL